MIKDCVIKFENITRIILMLSSSLSGSSEDTTNESTTGWFDNVTTSFGDLAYGRLRAMIIERALPAQEIDKDAEGLTEYEKISTPDGVKLDTHEFTPTEELKKPEKDRYYIIRLNGNGTCFQFHEQELGEMAQRLNCTVVGFNYRNVAYSTAGKLRVFHDLVQDGIAEVNNLLNRGVDPEKITLDGISLGGAIGIMVAAHFHARNQKIYLWVDRSLSSLQNVAKEDLERDAEKYGPSTGNSALSAMLPLMSVVGWDEDFAKAYLSIDEKYKSYVFIGKSSEKTGSCGDGMIDNAHCTMR